jgi:hypothetical protein
VSVAQGIGAVAEYMAAQLVPAREAEAVVKFGDVRYNAPVKSVAADGTSVTLQDGSRIDSSAVVVATEGNVARQLLSTAGVELEAVLPAPRPRARRRSPLPCALMRLGARQEREPKKTTCLYFAIDGPAPTVRPRALSAAPR